MPFLDGKVIKKQLKVFKTENCDVLVPKIGHFIEPLHAVYKKNLKNNIKHFIERSNNYSIRTFLKTVNVCYWNLDDSPSHKKTFININTDEDFKKHTNETDE